MIEVMRSTLNTCNTTGMTVRLKSPENKADIVVIPLHKSIP